MALAQAHPDWVVGFQDETWWSRVSPPTVSAWAEEGQPPRLVAQAVPAGEPKALACYGLLLPAEGKACLAPDEMWLRFVEGRPLSAITTAYLAWCGHRLAARGARVWVLIWDNAAWHISHEVRQWLREHNRAVKRSGQGVRILPCPLPVKSPWLNPIEVHWRHGKRQTAAPGRVLSVEELETRICSYYGCSKESHLVIPEKVA
jgi:hypothetical protein